MVLVNIRETNSWMSRVSCYLEAFLCNGPHGCPQAPMWNEVFSSTPMDEVTKLFTTDESYPHGWRTGESSAFFWTWFIHSKRKYQDSNMHTKSPYVHDIHHLPLYLVPMFNPPSTRFARIQGQWLVVHAGSFRIVLRWATNRCPSLCAERLC